MKEKYFINELLNELDKNDYSTEIITIDDNALIKNEV